MNKDSLKEILLDPSSNSDQILNHDITQGDISDFYNLYCSIEAQKSRYYQMVLGRKEAAKNIEKDLDLLKKMGKLIVRGLEFQENCYEYASRDLTSSSIEDAQKALEVLKQLASNDEIQYEIKTITYPAYDSIERHGYRTTEEYPGKITILADKTALEKLDDSKPLPYLTREMIAGIYHQGSSMVLVGNDESKTERLDLPNKYTIGHFNPIVFYLQEDSLANAALQFIDFIAENGTDFDQISPESIVKAIKTTSNNRKRQAKKEPSAN